MNLNAGDIILKINNNDILNEEHLNEVLEGYPTYIWLDVEKADGSLKAIEYKDYKKGIGNLGIIFSTENPDKYFELKMDSPLFDKLKNKLKSILGISE